MSKPPPPTDRHLTKRASRLVLEACNDNGDQTVNIEATLSQLARQLGQLLARQHFQALAANTAIKPDTLLP
ncbi:hypothetical protein [Niveispirillum irakense]|uniref:hypothetical protein n=1 Tax=Niveispirillum irakense TaxID=34011 RepID=UPI0004059403|nr:hypothetical protein [Niveispirillum irakense]